ncbi:MAG: hypothetical protein WCF67_12020 [Chitinophagaceae bacterium]
MIYIRCAIFSLIVLISGSAWGQSDWRSEIDQLIQQADSLSLKSQKTFSLLKPYHQDKDIRENWYYTTRNGRVVIFEIQYVIDSSEFSEIYYIHKGRLICMEQYEAPYLSVYADQLKRGESYFFLDNSLKQYVTTGNGRRSPGIWGTSIESMSKFNQRFAELQRHISYLR